MRHVFTPMIEDLLPAAFYAGSVETRFQARLASRAMAAA
ncbi:hypothetical protein COMA2_30093 [Candidatus Nitrospira nitrificans]|uniref:Uncharacterized protein n=1 Tax=Candidatus Nitrospira nitrificans TaxID=1742973 RepID=A0A0S4LJS4_9BACT|nr:hypothetical protein COMA2_30093 [Candidatus Nitrospira nitrificans]